MKLSLLLSSLVSAAALVRTPPKDGYRYIQLSDTEAKWMSPEEVSKLVIEDTGFADNTLGVWDDLAEFGHAREVLGMTAATYPDAMKHQSVVKPIAAKVSTSDLKTVLTEFVTSFSTRKKNTPEGEKSCQWVFDKANALASSHGRDDVKVTVRKFTHPWKQFSVIARVEPINMKEKELVILSGHQDSINHNDGDAAPGADDDGSGSITIYHALKYLLESKEWKPMRPFEVHWYAAEETGLQGSAEIAKDYASKRVPVLGLSQFDMDGYVSRTPKVTFITDNTNANLNTFLMKAVDEYCSIGYTTDRCGYGCSDHASWTRAGYAAAMPFEDVKVNPGIHSTRDNLDAIDWDHIAEFTKLAIAFVTELSQGSGGGPAPTPTSATPYPTSTRPTPYPTSPNPPSPGVCGDCKECYYKSLDLCLKGWTADNCRGWGLKWCGKGN